MSVECIPEWCDPETEGHDDTCPNAPYPLTKGEFVEAARTFARLGIEAFLVTSDEMGFSREEQVEMAVDGSDEAATCAAGIGSCGRGWCKHG